jgi:hypothetical protein
LRHNRKPRQYWQKYGLELALELGYNLPVENLVCEVPQNGQSSDTNGRVGGCTPSLAAEAA